MNTEAPIPSCMRAPKLNNLLDTIRDIVYAEAVKCKYESSGFKIMYPFSFLMPNPHIDYHGDKSYYLDGCVHGEVYDSFKIAFTVCVEKRVDKRTVTTWISSLLEDYKYLTDASLQVLSILMTTDQHAGID